MRRVGGSTQRLLVDLGNTRLKWTWAGPGARLVGDFHASADWRQRLPELIDRWREIAIDEVVWASVAEDARSDQLAQALASLARPMRRASVTAHRDGLVCAYADPVRLGVDRWLALLAAHRENPRTRQLLVSAGSALTLDVLRPGGVHAGGLIAPGLVAMQEGLMAAAPALARHRGGVESVALASDSPDAIASGCLQAALALIERHRRDRRGGRPCRVLLAGGDAERLAPWLSAPLQLRPRLVLEGLAVWACSESI